MAVMKGQSVERPAARKLSGLMVLAQVQHLRTVSSINLVLALICVIYFGCEVVLIILNSFELEPEDPEQEVVISKHIFHKLEFWSTFVFNVVGVISFFYSPDGPDAILRRPLATKAIFFINIAGSVVGAILITIDMETFELPSHELEYSIELTMAAVDMLMIASLWRRRQFVGSLAGRGFALSLGAVVLAIATATVQLVVYNCGEEQTAHYFEFAFEMFSSSVTFWFIMENKLSADAEWEELLHMDCCGPPEGEAINPEAGVAALEGA